MLIIARAFATGLGIWLIYNGITGSEFRGALPGSSLKGNKIPTWLGKLGFIVAGLFVLYCAWFKAGWTK